MFIPSKLSEPCVVRGARRAARGAAEAPAGHGEVPAEGAAGAAAGAAEEAEGAARGFDLGRFTALQGFLRAF